MEKLTTEMWLHSQNAFNLLHRAEELTKAISEYKILLDRQLLLNEVDRTLTCNNSEGYTKIKIDFEGVNKNFIGASYFKLFEKSELAEKVLKLLIDENMQQLDTLREVIPTLIK